MELAPPNHACPETKIRTNPRPDDPHGLPRLADLGWKIEMTWNWLLQTMLALKGEKAVLEGQNMPLQDIVLPLQHSLLPLPIDGSGQPLLS